VVLQKFVQVVQMSYQGLMNQIEYTLAVAQHLGLFQQPQQTQLILGTRGRSMPRGAASKLGDVYTSQNGYHYTRIENGWRLTHQIVAEEKLGRPLKENERVRFIDGDRTNLDPKNLQVVFKRTSSLRARLAKIDSRMAELKAERAAIVAQLKKQEAS